MPPQSAAAIAIAASAGAAVTVDHSSALNSALRVMRARVNRHALGGTVMIRRMRTRGLVLTTLAALCAAPGTAAAAPPTPAKAPVVARDGAVTLTAKDEERRLCVSFTDGRSLSESCGEKGAGTATLEQAAGFGDGSRGTYVGAAVTAPATSVEVRRAGALLASSATVAGEAYRGKRAGSVRFALVRLPPRAKLDGLRVRALDAAGTAVEVLAPGESTLITDRRVLLSGRSGRTRWAVRGERSSELSSSVVDLDHEAVSRCLRVTAGSDRGSESSGSCTGDAPRDAFEGLFSGGRGGAGTTDRCRPRFRLVHGVADANVTGVSALLGDGRRVAARSAPFADAGKVVYALVVPAGAAVRSLRVERSGQKAHIVAFSVPPLAVTCASGEDPFSELGVTPDLLSISDLIARLPNVTPVGPVTTIPGPPSVRVADGPGESLCVALETQPFNAFGCAVVSPGFGELTGAFDNYTRPRAFALALPAKVATVRIAAKGGTPRELPTVAGDGYAGLYAGRVRFAAATLSSPRELYRYELLDAAGRVLHSETDDTVGAEPTGPRAPAPRRLAGAPGRPSLWQTSFRDAGHTARCLALTAGRPPRTDDRCESTRDGPFSAIVGVPCTTHRLTVAVTALAGSRVTADTGRGPRVLALRRGAGLLTLPASRGLRSLSIVRRGHRTLRIPVHAPAGAKQCGWATAPTLRRG